MIPELKRKVKSFLVVEEGKISKTAWMTISAIAVGALGAESVTASDCACACACSPCGPCACACA